MVDLSAQPYNLDSEAIAWVEKTISEMTEDEKIGQLFVNMGASRTEEYLTGMVNDYHIGAVRYNPGPAADIWEQNYILQTKSKIPLLIAANTEGGGNGACTDGTYVGHQVKIGATADPHWAYQLGRISGIEAAAIGCNWSFAPVVDVIYNWRNPIVSTRTYGDDPELVLKMSKEYLRGIMESGIMPGAKHFPGDGVDDRDHHISSSINSYDCDQWDATFGHIYAGLIAAGLPSIMVGHIMLPSYQKHFNPNCTDADLLPASLCKELTTDLLRGKLGFNGVVVTDASHMVGMTGAMKRRDLLPAAIAAGCDLFLFFNDPDEDFAWMRDGYRNGVITEDRLTDALRRILGLKARIGLHNTPRDQILPPKAEAMARIGLAESKSASDQVADRAITLVKQQAGVLPVTPDKYARVLVVPVSGPKNPIAAAMGYGSVQHPATTVADQLREQGFDVTLHKSMLDEIADLSPEEQGKAILNVYAAKAPIAGITGEYELVILVAKIEGLMQATERVFWPATKGTLDIPWYVHEVPTIYVSVTTPFALVDVPQVKTYINTYDDKPNTLTALVQKLVGKSQFVGTSSVDAFCGLADTRI